ncbi:BamA/TamA family outer membrane protein [Rufibacter glacialis]|uniref:BamA/TamA family outer membrane protein n=1 Tax=Rufibacter glacialis TaxID=1259555 RepID=A0A5M8Q4E0_9BACT|nr:BamA/TamA family outer membrane protein [Rufibacter glacialis]KAA6430243.1 BamA/TamA family outer membrane protein [Rufibacter glacialis]GGK87671.1 membrane protein [Rufibacter glacialis]
MIALSTYVPFLRSSLLWNLPLVVLLVTLAGCSSTKSVPQGDYLYIGGDIKVTSPVPETDTEHLESELNAAIRPQPNLSFLGMRPKLWIYNAMGGKRERKGVANWIKTRLGEPPVLLSEAHPDRVKGQMLNRLYNNGYFSPSIEHSVDSTSKRKMAMVHYAATVGKQYTIQQIQFPQGNDSLSIAIRETEPQSLLKVNDPYNLEKLIAERLRVNEILKEKGFFFFDEGYIIYHVDSTLNNKVNIYIRIKDIAPKKALIPYRYQQVSIYTDFSLGDPIGDSETPPVQFKDYKYYPDEETFKAKTILNAVFVENGDLYSRKRHLQTVNRLMDLGTFKFAEVRFTPLDSIGLDGRLNADILLTQAKKKSVRAEVQTVQKSNGYAGPGITVSFRNRNALRGAELLLVNLVGSFESQISGDSARSGLTSMEVGADAEMHVPRIISPFNIRLSSSLYQPRTRFALGFRFINRQEFFQQNSFNFEYGYSWRQRATTQIQLNPVQVQYSRLINPTPAFEAELLQRPFLARAFDQQLIIGGNYRFIYNTQGIEGSKHQFYISPGLDLSGGLWGLFYRVKNQRPADPENPNRFRGQALSQYVKIDLETRYNFNITSKLVLATRFLGGYGLPYGNSTVLPYIKQYGIGGPNSIRAFPARSIGPGLYDPTQLQQGDNPVSQSFSYFDQTGDIRLEGNAEFRFPLLDPYLKGAFFVDAGNIWLVSEDPTRPGGKFSGDFMSQLAVGAGAGVRVDVQFFVIRVDLAYPLRDPTYPNGGRPTSGLFGKGVLNLAIGYPF